MDRQRSLFAADAARQRGHDAAMAAASRAERLDPGWMAKALDQLRDLVKKQHPSVAFTMEAARSMLDLPPPPDLRVWGAVTVQAVEAGIIKRKPGASAPADSSNGSLKPMYLRGDRA